MTYRALACSMATLAAFVTLTTQAQGLRLSPSLSSAARTAAAVPTGAQHPAEFIVAVINSEPITNSEVRAEALRLSQQLALQRRPQPAREELIQVVMDRMINDKVQLQLAREGGIRIEDVAVDQAEQNVARQNKIDVAELRRRLAADGLALSQFREQLRDQLALVRLREREVDSKVRVSDLEVEQYRREQQSTNATAAQEINIAQILVAVPEAATPTQVAALQARAQTAQTRAAAGEDFGTLARDLSDSPDRTSGGQLGLRTADRLPPLFIEATQNLTVGGVSAVLRSGAGFHILKLIEKHTAGLTVTQSHARHILLRASPKLSEAAARDKLSEFQRRVQAGQADFAVLARETSQDSSAAQGGDLGWASPGQFVPEFEEVLNSLTPGQVSDPLISRFGVHLIQLLERRTTPLSQRDQNEVIRNTLREKKLDEAYVTWAQDVRGRAYVELRESPQ